MRLRNTPNVLLVLAIVALTFQHRRWLTTKVLHDHPTSALTPPFPPPVPQNRYPSPPPPPSPPPSTLAQAISNRIAASIAAEAAEDLKSDYSRACNPVPNAGFSGGAFTWGITFRVESAAECCSACQAHQRVCGPNSIGQVYHTRIWQGAASAARCLPMPGTKELRTTCNVWSFCGEERCWSSDKWNHTRGECWLKYQKDPFRPLAPAYGAYPAKYRERHATAPPLVQWTSGSLTDGSKSISVDGPHWPPWSL